MTFSVFTFFLKYDSFTVLKLAWVIRLLVFELNQARLVVTERDFVYIYV